MTDENLRERVDAALRSVRESESGANAVEAGLVSDVRVDGGDVTVEAAVGQVDPRSAQGVFEAMLAAVRDVEGVTSAHAESARPSGSDRVSIADVDTVVAVASTKGGVGKTTVAVRLACALAAESTVGLFDADIFGPNAPSILDVDGPVYSDDADRPVPVAADGMELMSVGLLSDGGPLAWRGAMAHDALSDLFADTAWGADVDTLVIDLPPGTSDVALTTLQEVPIDGVVFVTTPFHTSVEDTRRSRRLFEENGVPVLGAVVNMERFECEACGHDHDMFPGGSPVAELDVPTLARLPFSSDLQSRPTPGDPDETFARLAADVRERLDAVDRIELPPDPVDLRGMESRERVDRVREAFERLGPGETLYVVSDRDPTPAGEFLVDLAGGDGDPVEVFPDFAVERRGLEKWVMKATRPTAG